MRFRTWVAAFSLALAAVLPGAALAQKRAEPAVAIKLRSVNDLFDKAEYLAGLVDKEDPVQQARGFLKGISVEGKGIEGLDPKKPIGAYAIVAPDIQSSPVIVMAPIADQEAFFAALKKHLSIEPEKAADGTFKISVPLINELHLRFANGYLYLGRAAKDLDAAGLIAPKDFFANDDGAVISLAVRFDRIPKDVKTLFFGQFEQKVMEEHRQKQNWKSEVEKKAAELTIETGIGAVKMLLDDGQELSLKGFADPKPDDLRFELSLTAKNGSPLAKTISGLAGRTSLPAAIAAAKDPVARISTKAGLPEELKKRLAPLIDQAVKYSVADAEPGDREAARRVMEPLAATAKAGNLDFAATLAGPDAKKHYALIAAVMVSDAKELEKVAKDFAATIPAEVAGVTFDVEKVGKFALHKVLVKAADAEFVKRFGTKTVWVAVADNCIAISIEPDGALLKAGLMATPAPAPVILGEVALAKLVPLVEKKLKPDEMHALIKDSFGDSSPAGRDTIRLAIEGGQQLTVKFKMKGKAFRLATMLDQFKLK